MKKIIKKFFQEIIENRQLAPIVSGGTAIFLLWKIIFSNLEGEKFQLGLSSVGLLFLVSAVLYYYLRKLEKDKDVYLISSIGKIIEDVFRHYGQQMANKNAEMAKAEDMDKIMQTIVALVSKMKNLAIKDYVSK